MKKNKAVHKGNGLLPYPVIVSINATINMYKNDHIKMYKINST